MDFGFPGPVDLSKKKKISVVYDSVVEEFLGDGKLITGVKLKNVKTGDMSELRCQGVFLAIAEKE